jgi:hypothetical protein
VFRRKCVALSTNIRKEECSKINNPKIMHWQTTEEKRNLRTKQEEIRKLKP